MFKPVHVLILAAAMGFGLAAAGIYILAGLGWALIALAVPFLILSLVIVRGLTREQ